MATAALRAVLPLKFPADAILRNFFRENPKLGSQVIGPFVPKPYLEFCGIGFFWKMPATQRRAAIPAVGLSGQIYGLNLRELETAFK